MNLSYVQVQKKYIEFQNYLNLIDNYDVKNFSQWIIKEYAIYNSVPKVIYHARINSSPYYALLTPEIIKETILKNPDPSDQLHREIRKSYMQKIRKSK